MNAMKIVPAVLTGLALAATVVHAQSPTDRRPGSCALSRSCPAGASIDVIPYVTMHRNTGTLRLQIHPTTSAEIYVDGVYAGRAEDFDGVSRRTALTAGAHRIEVRAEGYEHMHFQTRIEKSRTTIQQTTLSPALGKPQK